MRCLLILCKVGEAMKLREHLSDEEKRRLIRMVNSKEKVNWHELMGVNRDTYKRSKGGAIRSINRSNQ